MRAAGTLVRQQPVLAHQPQDTAPAGADAGQAQSCPELELRLALQRFRQTYNQTWIIERHGYLTPAQVRADQITRMPLAA